MDDGSLLMPKVKIVPMPSGNIIDLFPFQGWLNGPGTTISQTETLVEMCRTVSDYRAEALIYKSISQTRLLREALDVYPIGIHSKHHLRPLRDLYWRNWNGKTEVPEEVALVLWGAPCTSGKKLYASAGVFLRSRGFTPHVASHPELYGQLDAGDLILEWAKASGISHHKTLYKLEQLVSDHFLMVRPEKTFVSLAASEMDFAQSVAGPDPRLAFAFFRCLQRIAAWSYRGRVCWRSAWLRGRGQSGDAIPGASTYSSQLKSLLDKHVWLKVKGHSAKKAAARYELKKKIDLGPYGPEDFAARVRLALKADHSPKKI